METDPLDLHQYKHIIFFTGAGMSAESGVPTYRGDGGVWNEYNWQEYACQEAWERDPEKVFDFHDLRRQEALKCHPHDGHHLIADIQRSRSNVTIVTQNIDGMHQRAGSQNVIELHGSLWRLRCEQEGLVIDDLSKGLYQNRKCNCGSWLRPDIIWFSDMLNSKTVQKATVAISSCDLFISIGTSGVVWPAAGYPQLARDSGALCIEINPQPSEQSWMYDQVFQYKAGDILPNLFNM